MSTLDEIVKNIHRFQPHDGDFDTHSELHGRLHTMRVMAWTCVLAQKLNKPDLGRLAFFAALVHDMGRLTDNTEPGHGQRSADFHLPLWRKLFQEFGLTDLEYQTVAEAIRWHSKSDEPSAGHPNLSVIHLLKDADALDRVRLWGDEPDVSYMRYPISASLVTAARRLYRKTEAEPTMQIGRVYELAVAFAADSSY